MTLEPDMQTADVLSKPWADSPEDTPLSRIPGVPLYVQIRESLRDMISRQSLRPGQRIPSEDELAAHYSVSRMTVRKAIADLVDDGMMYRAHGVGTFVAHTHIIRDHSKLTDFSDDPSLQGMEADVQILSREPVPASAKVAQALALAEDEPVIRYETLRLLDDEPVTLSVEYVAQRITPHHLVRELGSRAIWWLLERHGWKVSRAVEKLESRPAPPGVSHLLEVEPGAPVFYKERIVFAEDGTPLEYQECHSRGDKYTCTVVLRR
jgi:GntR family transcriptional regulator